MKNSPLKLALGLLCCFCLFSCTKGPAFYFKKEAKIKKLGVQLAYEDSLYEILGAEYDFQLNHYIENFNSKTHAFTLYRTENSDSCALKIRIYRVRLATAKDQMKATAISTLGVIALPAALILAQSPIVVWFWVRPRNVSYTELSLSPDLANHPTKRFKLARLYSNAYYGGEKRQLKKHKRKVYTHLDKILRTVEHNYLAQRKIYERKRW